jgi:peptidoglycan/LPS O-acetylase OafA/YrhL
VVHALFGPGSTGVSFFFVLSGFVLTWAAPPVVAPWRFWRRRLARVYPLHLATAGVALVLGVPAGLVALANLTLVHAWVPDEAYWQSLNTVSWTLSCEAFFYLVFPFVLSWAARPRLLGGFALVVAIGGPLLAPDASWFWHWCPLGRLPEFLFGMALARSTSVHGERLGRLWGFAAVTAVAGYVVSVHAPPALRPAACTLVGFGLVLVAAATSDIRGRRAIWSRPWVVRLGELSYAFYLVHLLVMRILERFIGYHPRFPTGPALVMTISVLGISAGSSWLLHTYVERPARTWLLTA